MAGVGVLLDRLEAVRRTGSGRWVARCPAHRDRRPSLSIRECADGRILLHCFTGCGAVDVLDALGLDWAALFPERLEAGRSERRRSAPPIPARDALELLSEEALVVELAARQLAAGEPIERHRANLELASRRIAGIRAAYLEAPR